MSALRPETGHSPHELSCLVKCQVRTFLLFLLDSYPFEDFIQRWHFAHYALSEIVGLSVLHGEPVPKDSSRISSKVIRCSRKTAPGERKTGGKYGQETCTACKESDRRRSWFSVRRLYFVLCWLFDRNHVTYWRDDCLLATVLGCPGIEKPLHISGQDVLDWSCLFSDWGVSFLFRYRRFHSFGGIFLVTHAKRERYIGSQSQRANSKPRVVDVWRLEEVANSYLPTPKTLHVHALRLL